MDLPQQITIQTHKITIVPRYAETDKAGVVHHSVYPIWFEMGRTELLRANGVAYRDLEAAGIFFVVVELRIKYRRPAFYDQPLTLETGARVSLALTDLTSEVFIEVACSQKLSTAVLPTNCFASSIFLKPGS